MEEKITDTVQENYLGENTASGVDSKENTDSGEIVDSDNELVKSMNVIQDMITDKKYEFRDAGNGNVQLYVDGVAKGEPMAIDKASKITSAVISQLNSKKIDAKTAGDLLSQGFASGILNGKSGVINAGINLASSAISAVRNKLDIHSPSRVTRELGKYFSQGFSLGVEDEESNAVKTVKNFSSEMLEGLDDVYLQMQRFFALKNTMVHLKFLIKTLL